MEVKTITTCCDGLLVAPLSEAAATDLAAAFKVMADPIRLRLLSIVAAQGETCACNLTAPLGKSQPTISHHLSVLTDAGLLRREKRGKWAWYSVAPERFAVLRDALASEPVAAHQ
jgi:ArsR family transcriptional regulator